MKTVVIDGRESGTSTGRYVDKLVEYMHGLKPSYKVIVLTKFARISYLQTIAPDFTVIPTRYKEFTFGEQLGFKKQIEHIKPDLVHFPMVQQPVLYKGKVVTTMQDLTGIRFKNPAKNPFVHWIKRQVYKWVNKRVAHISDLLITPTQFVKDDVVAYTHVSPDKITVTLESADSIKDKAKHIVHLQDMQFILYVGRPAANKNLERLIDAFVKLKAAHPDLHLVLVGKKDERYRQIETNVQAHTIRNVIFTDFVSEGQLRWLYEHCAAYIFPSLSEGFGLPGLEAMRHGAPVISSNATCLPEVYGDAAHYFDPHDVQSIANAINDVLSSEGLRRELISKGNKQIKKYSWKRMAEQTLDVYKRALGD